VRLPVRGFAAWGVVVCLQALTLACSSRTTPATSPPPAVDQPAASPVAAPQPTPAPTPLPQPEVDPCAVVESPGDPIGIVALTERIDPSHAPRPSNESERLIFRQLYETLVTVDCLGRLRPGLASSWRLDTDGNTWILALREDARFSDGAPVSAADVRASWTHDDLGELRSYVSRFVASIVVVDDRSLAVRLRTNGTGPNVLAHPDLAILKAIVGLPWPLGTRGARVSTEASASRGVLPSLTLTRDSGSAIRFLLAAGDPRDVLDNGVDLLLTRDPAALAYATTLAQFQLVPLAWQRTYILLQGERAAATRPLSKDARELLAKDAVRGEARGAAGPFWWDMPTSCVMPPPSPSSINSRAPIPRIVYDAKDPTARELAERFVGLRVYQRATGLSDDALTVARRRGADAGYILSVESRSMDPCGDLQALTDIARWLDPKTIIPLVDTRMHAVVRRGRSGITAEWDAGLVIAGGNGSR
jgi:extracellular solute-binding protein (family 5)